MDDKKLTFGQRFGGDSIKVKLQTKSLDSQTRIRIWNLIYALVFKAQESNDAWSFGEPKFHALVVYKKIWSNIFLCPSDEFPTAYFLMLRIKDLILKGSWTEVYGFLENFLQRGYDIELALGSSFSTSLINIMREELCGFTVINNLFVPVTDAVEVEEIKLLLNQSSGDKFVGIRKHLQTALSLIAEKDKPHFNKVIHESISMVEAICKIIEPKAATLPDALRKLKSSGLELHPALNAAFEKLYSYTSDAQGIRHAHKFHEKQNLDIEEAKFFLIISSAFVNYLIVKAQKHKLLE